MEQARCHLMVAVLVLRLLVVDYLKVGWIVSCTGGGRGGGYQHGKWGRGRGQGHLLLLKSCSSVQQACNYVRFCCGMLPENACYRCLPDWHRLVVDQHVSSVFIKPLTRPRT